MTFMIYILQKQKLMTYVCINKYTFLCIIWPYFKDYLVVNLLTRLSTCGLGHWNYFLMKICRIKNTRKSASLFLRTYQIQQPLLNPHQLGKLLARESLLFQVPRGSLDQVLQQKWHVFDIHANWYPPENSKLWTGLVIR